MLPEGIFKYEPLWGEWHIGELIGKGSYGEVYKIYRDVGGKREYAAAKYISIPKSEQDKELAYSKGLATDEESLRSFFETRANTFSKEIDLMMKLRDSANVVRYEAHLKQEKADDVGWDIIIRMELLTSLEKYLRTNSFSKKDVIRLGIDICGAIESCQNEKIIHRDVKTENIFIDSDDKYKLGDFGVSREAQGTTMGTLTGTEDYMAPEIMQHKEYNNNVDIYSIGIVMYRLLNNNRIPFLPAEGPINDNDISIALSKRIAGTEEIPNPKFADGELARIIKKACENDRHKRYSSPKQMADELKKVLENTENITVSSPRKKATKTPTGGTVADIKRKITGGSTVSELPTNDMGGTVTDIPSKGTVSEFSDRQTSGSARDAPKKKKAFILAATAIVVCLIAVVAFAFMPKSIPVTDIAGLPEEAISMAIGDERELTYELSPTNTTDEIKFESSDNEIAEVDNDGKITAKAEGTVQITIKCGSVEKIVEVSVAKQKIPVTAIEGVENSAVLDVGAAITLHPIVMPEDATNPQVTYQSSNAGVATVGPDGVITGVSAGTTTISITADGVTKEMALTVKAKTPEPTKKVEEKRCPTCGSTAHTVHPQEVKKCPVCGSTSHTTHPTCPVCGSTSHTTHPTCPVCGSTSHTVHPTEPPAEVKRCPKCGSTEHTVHNDWGI